MDGQDRRRFRRQLIFVAIFGTVLAVVPLDQLHLSHDSWYLVVLGQVLWFLQKVGDAMLTAVVLTLVVDKAAKTTLLKEFALDISGHIIGWHLPQMLRDHLQKYLTLDIVRREWNVTYRLEEITDHPGFVVLRHEISSDYDNLSAKEQSTSLTLEIEKSWFPDIGEATIDELWFNDSCLYPGSSQKITEGHEAIRLQQQIQLPPRAQSPDSRYAYRANATTYHATNGISPMFSLFPVLKATVKVYYPVKKLRVDLLLTFGEVDQDTRREARTAGDEVGIVSWILNTPILPGQGFLLQWAPLKGAAA